MNLVRSWQPAFVHHPRVEKGVSFVKDLVKEFRDDDLGGAAAELAFRFFLAFFPFLLMLLTIGAFVSSATGVSDPAQEVVDLFGDSLPGDAASVIRSQTEQVVENDSLSLLTVGFLGTLWAAGNGTAAIMKATNRVYDVEESRPFLKRTGLAIALTLLAGGAIIIALAATLVSEVLARDIAESIGLGRAFGWLVTLVRIPLVLLLIVGAASLVYWLAPDTKRPFKLVTPGAFVFAIGWAAATWLFALYVSHFGNYNATYGALGAAIILLTWLQLTSTLLLLGAELNSVVDPAVDTEESNR